MGLILASGCAITVREYTDGSAKQVVVVDDDIYIVDTRSHAVTRVVVPDRDADDDHDDTDRD
ncbi:MAG: hypothetical protein D6788_07690 [Planctomycetota bacterium]|nr:MAG: hypothetical protein D6788_07690 [Planctomycetota bacterium]